MPNAMLTGHCVGAGVVGQERVARPTTAAETQWSGERSERS